MTNRITGCVAFINGQQLKGTATIKLPEMPRPELSAAGRAIGGTFRIIDPVCDPVTFASGRFAGAAMVNRGSRETRSFITKLTRMSARRLLLLIVGNMSAHAVA